jgi:hypothetical protein
MKRAPTLLAMGCAALTLQACAASVEPANQGPVEPTGGLVLPKAESLLPKVPRVVGTPTELYTRIARGALTCWFGATGPLKGSYIYHADAAPASQGGRSEIVIRIRDATKVASSEQKSLRAFRVLIAPGESKPVVEIENVKMAEPLATRLTDDVHRWAGDEEGCGAPPPADQWSAKPGSADEPKTKKPTRKTAGDKKRPAAEASAKKPSPAKSKP